MTATTTYLQIVNSSINESGADSATFATNGSDFTTRTDKYMNQFKTWVSRAWRDIQIECYDWDFMQEQGLCTLAPGIMFYTDGTSTSVFSTALGPNEYVNVYDQSGTVALPLVNITAITDLTGEYTLTKNFFAADLGGYTSTTPLNIALKPGAEYIKLDQSQYSFTGASHTGTAPSTPFTANITLFGPAASYTGQITVTSYNSGTEAVVFNTYTPSLTTILTSGGYSSFTLVDTNSAWSLSVNVNAQTPTVLSTVKAYVHSWRSYDFNEEVSSNDFQESIEQINDKSFRSIDYLQSPPAGEIPIPFMPWETYRSSYDISSAYPGTPRLVTKDDTGRYRFYPALYYPFSVKFDYSRRPQILSVYSDVPRGINDEFTDLIMWRAINYYGEYMEQPSIIARSERRYKDLLSRLEQKNREMFHFKPAKLW